MSVLDASALLAWIHQERGHETVDAAIDEGASISAVNLAEVLVKAVDRGLVPSQIMGDLSVLGVTVHPFTAEGAQSVAALRPLTVGRGLSLGDSACLALGIALGQPVLTSDARWSDVSTPADVRQIR